MSTVLEIISAAYRRSGVIGAGVVIDATKKDVGLERLQALYKDMAEGLFGRQEDTLLTSATAYTAQEFERVINTAGAVVTLPTTVNDVFQDGSQKRPPVDGCVITVVVPGQDPTMNIYDANRAQWMNLNNLGLTDYAPLSNRWEDGLKNLLAVLLADDVGLPVGPVLAKRAGSARLSIASRYGSKRRTTPVEYF
jgi:hypothetical protein